MLQDIPAEKSEQPYTNWISNIEKEIAKIKNEVVRRDLNSLRNHLMVSDILCCSTHGLYFILARTTSLRKIEKMIDLYIFCKSTGLEKFTGANCDHIGPFIETLSGFKVGAH